MKLNFRSYTWSVVLSVVAASGWALDQVRAAAPYTEAGLIAVLQSDAPKAEKAITCKRLAIYGSKTAVPVLAPLLLDKELNSWARTALEAIPDPAADQALRDAVGKAQDRQLIGVINSIGFRRDAQAVEALSGLLKDANADVVAAAGAALGAIGGAPAAKALQQALDTVPAAARMEVAHGCVRCAERFLAEGKTAEAIELYDTVRKANVPKQQMLEATRGAILARGTGGLPLLLEQLRSPDKALFGVGLHTARELPGREVTETVCAEVERADVDRQTLLVLVLADRADPAGWPTIRKAAQSGSKRMRLAAIGALERMANPASVPVLLEVAAAEDRELAQAAKAALVRLSGKEVNADLVARLAQATGTLRRVLIELAGQRRILEALAAVAQYVGDADAGIRSAAVATVGMIGEENQAAELVKLLANANAKERADIEKALLSISGRRRANCLPSLLPLAKSGDSELRIIGLHTLASVGGSEALAVVKAGLEEKDEAVQDEAVRTLAAWPGNWPDDAGVADPLLTLAKSGKKTSHQVLGLRGYLEYVQVDKKLKDEDKAAKVKELQPLITRAEEKRLAIKALGAAPTGPSLEMLAAYAAEPAVAEEACLAILDVAVKDDLKDGPKELRQKSLQTVVDKSTVRRTQQRAREALKTIR
jgi:HEAT repeat protein